MRIIRAFKLVGRYDITSLEEFRTRYPTIESANERKTELMTTETKFMDVFGCFVLELKLERLDESIETVFFDLVEPTISTDGKTEICFSLGDEIEFYRANTCTTTPPPKSEAEPTELKR